MAAAMLTPCVGATGAVTPDRSRPAPLGLSADEVRTAMLDRELAPGAPTRGGLLSTPDPLARSRSAVALDEINPSLRLEYGSGADRFTDPSEAIDGLNANERAERGLAPSDASRLYDAVLRFEAARIGDVALLVRSGVRGGAPGASAAFDSLRFGPVAGAGLEWSPRSHPELFISGGALFAIDERENALNELSAELGMRVTPDMSFSLGYRTLDSNFAAPSDAAEELRNAAFAAIRLRF